MANLTIAVDDKLLQLARVRAVSMGTSVNAVQREYLVAFAGKAQPQVEAVREFRAVAARRTAGKAACRPVGWSRDELHDRARTRG